MKGKYDIKDFWDLYEKGVHLRPQDFGCKDWCHNPDGELDMWVPPNPRDRIYGPFQEPEPRERQRYTGIMHDLSRLENMRRGWEKAEKERAVADFWKRYDEYN